MAFDDVTLEKIIFFLNKHHTLSLATCKDNQPYCCTVFYAYDNEKNSFIIASHDDTQHIKNIKINSNVAGTVHLETDIIGDIQGIQFSGKIVLYKGSGMIYFKRFPISTILKPLLWSIHIESFKMTDNRFGFGKKLIWQMA